MEEEAEEDEGDEEELGEERTQEQLSNMEACRASSKAFLLSDPQDISEGLVNPAFSEDDSRPSSQSRHSSLWRRPKRSPRLACMSRDHPYSHCRSLSSSVENMTFSGAPLSPMRGSFPSLNDTMNKESLCGGRSFRDKLSLWGSRSQGTVVNV